MIAFRAGYVHYYHLPTPQGVVPFLRSGWTCQTGVPVCMQRMGGNLKGVWNAAIFLNSTVG